MKKWIAACLFVIFLSALCAASAESFWNFFTNSTTPEADPVFTPVYLPQADDLIIMGVSPKGDYLAFRNDCSSLGMIRNGVYKPFTRNESRGVPDEYGCLDSWENFEWLIRADDPIWSPDGRWLILTSYYECWIMNNPMFPVLIDMETNEYFLLYSESFEYGSLTNNLYFSAGDFSLDSKQLYVILYDTNTGSEKTCGCTLFSWDLDTGTRTDLQLVVSDDFLDSFQDQLIEEYGPDGWKASAMEEVQNRAAITLHSPAQVRVDGSLVCVMYLYLFYPSYPQLACFTFDTLNNTATLHSLTYHAPEEYDTMEYRVGTQKTLTLFQSGGISASSCPPYFLTDLSGKDEKYFMILYGYPNDQNPASDESTFSILQSLDAAFPELTAAEKVSYAASIQDFALSPDGKSAVVHVMPRGNGRDTLLHIRLDDLKITLLYETELYDSPLPKSQASYIILPNNHFTWSSCGTILMTHGNKSFAFRVD